MKLHQLQLSHPSYRPDIDGLRAIAVISVVAYHAFPASISGGFIGVDIFFVISGYLISTIILENLGQGNFSFSQFYSRRIKRIFPALLIVLIACFAFGWFALLSDEYKQLGKHIAGSASFIQNFILWNESGYFNNTNQTKPLLHLWSLGIEEQFYIAWPLFLWFFWKLKINLLKITLIIAISTFLLNIKGVGEDPVATFYLPHTRIWELLSGSLLAHFTIYKKTAPSNMRSTAFFESQNIYFGVDLNSKKISLSNIASFIGFILLLFGFFRINKDVDFPGNWAIVPVLGAVLLIFAGTDAWINRKVLSNKCFVWFGLISFPLYLWHWPLLSFARIVESEVPNVKIRIAAVLISVILAYFTYKFVERPMRFGNHQNIKTAVLSLLLVIIGFLGFNVYENDGYELRDSVKGFVDNKSELVRTPAIDDACIIYTGLVKPLFHYCRFANANSNETVAVIGDSHAHVAYPGIAEYLGKKGVNTILMANSSCPPFTGVQTGNNKVERDACRDRIEQLLGIVAGRQDIKKVFIFTRGPTYITGTEPSVKKNDLSGLNIIPIDEFVFSAQKSFDRLYSSGKQLYYITENPELNYLVGSCLSRPFKPVDKICTVEKSSVLERQADYLKAFKSLKNVTIIDSISVFCPDRICIVFDENGSLLYADADHLSVAGSRFQVNKLLHKFLD